MAEGFHSRAVVAARVGLPVAALALLSTLFLAARTVDPSAAIPFADVALSERVRDQQLTAPRVTGRAGGGTAFEIRADAARPDPEDPRRIHVDRLGLVLGLPTDPSITRVAADRGEVDSAARTLVLEGAVVIRTTDGFRLRSDRLEGSLGRLRILSPGPVRGEAPFGTLRAGAMTLTEGAGGGGGRRLVFTGGVEVLYAPPTPRP